MNRMMTFATKQSICFDTAAVIVPMSACKLKAGGGVVARKIKTSRPQRGFTLIEAIGALAIMALLSMSLSAMIDSSLEDSKGQQAALYQEQVTDAASQYIAANYASLVSATASGSVAAVTLAQLQAGGFLSAGTSSTNVYNQTPCVLVRQSAANKLDSLVVTYGGAAIPERDLPMVAMQAGRGGGYISATATGIARGASWQLDTTPYRGVSCGGATVLVGPPGSMDGGHLVSSLFYDGPGQQSTDFLYRNVVQGRPELNQMSTPLTMANGAIVNENAPCTAAGIAFDSARNLMSCDSSGAWKRVTTWKRPVDTFADLPTTDSVGDVRMTLDTGRAFMYSAASNWQALAVDQNGDLYVARDANVTRNVNPGQDVNVARNVNAGQNVNVGDYVNLNKDVNVGGNVNVYRNVNVGDYVNLNKDVNVGGNVNAGGNVNVGGNVGVANNLYVGQDVDAGRDVNAGRYVNAGQ